MTTVSAQGHNTPDVLMRFSSVVVVGASNDAERIGGSPIYLLRKYGFAGQIFGLNPKYSDVQGAPCFATPEDLPQDVDVAVFCVGAAQVKELLPRLQKKGVKGAVIFSAGFGEAADDGKAMQQWLTGFARKSGIAVLGPNSLGQVSFANRRPLTFANAVCVQPAAPAGRLALLSQSGGVAMNIWADASLKKVSFSHVVMTGNEADLGFGEYLSFFATDTETDAVLGYVEALNDGAAFCAGAEKLRQAGKPLVLLKVGTSALGRDAVSSHTGLLSSDDTGYQAAFDRYGVIRAYSLQELNDFARLLSIAEVRPGVTVASTTGGGGVYVADLCGEFAVPLAGLSKETGGKLRDILPSFGRVANPVDLTAQVVNDNSILERSVDVLMQDPETGVVLFLLTGKGSPAKSREVIDIFKQLTARAPKPLVLCWLGVSEQVRMQAADEGLVVYDDPRRFIAPLGALLKARRNAPSPASDATRGIAPVLPDGMAPASRRRVMSEAACMEVLENVSVDCPRRVKVSGASELTGAVARTGFPCVMKLSLPQLTHKSDAGGVVLGISSQAELEQAWNDMQTRFNAREVIVVEQIPSGVEMLVGCLRDPTFGMRMTIGAGGIWTSFANSVVSLIPPLTEGYVREQLERLPIWAQLAGARGQKPYAIEALVRACLQIAAAAQDWPDLVEFECNPVIVTHERAVAVDALAILDPGKVP
jgi:acetyltransferase